MEKLTDKNIIITGASSGIGRSCAIRCNQAGARVHLIARNRKNLEEVACSFEPGSYSLNVLDVTQSENIEAVIKRIVDEYGHINGFIHSAGIQYIQPLRYQDKAHFIEVFSVNTFSAFEFSRILIKKKYTNPDGMSIVFISSVMSVAANAGLTSYCASKAALVGGARALAIELASRNIRVNCVSPGTVSDTRMTERLQESVSAEEYQKIVKQYPMGLGETSDIASLCVFLLSDVAKWITGQNIVIDGGYSVL